jgi:hypothetical protein
VRIQPAEGEQVSPTDREDLPPIPPASAWDGMLHAKLGKILPQIS